ncbi:MAG: alpha/beta hydrolase [Pseudomonadota bacterium]|nr:alpha/beta hydrolase [Pseudomonadota bacterium]
MNRAIDVRDILPSIHVPTLVLRRVEDPGALVETSRYRAEHIPGAKYVELPGNAHLHFVGDADAFIDEI